MTSVPPAYNATDVRTDTNMSLSGGGAHLATTPAGKGVSLTLHYNVPCRVCMLLNNTKAIGPVELKYGI